MNLEKVATTLKRVDWALLLAGLVEIPRWSVAFMAIHEPAVFGVPLAAIITWSMSSGWELYFRRPQERLILAFNLLALGISTVIITPVLYLLTQSGTFNVTMTDFRLLEVDGFRLVWALALALGTFLPLISLAAVRSRAERAEPETPRAEVETARKRPEVKPDPVPVQEPAVADDRKQRAWQMAQNGVTQEEIAATYGVSTRTVRNWLKSV